MYNSMGLKHIVFLCCFLGFGSASQAQDYFYTQKFATPSTLSPAFIGKQNGVSVGLQYRDAWSNLPGTFTFADLSADGYFPNIRMILGGKLSYQQLGSAGYYITGGEIQGGYHIYIAKLRQLFLLIPAISIGLYNTGVNVNKLLFYDQLLNGGPSSTVLYRNNRMFFDINLGFAFMTNKNYALSMNVFHLNFANKSFERVNTDVTPMRINLVGLYRFALTKQVGNAWANQDMVVIAETNYQEGSVWTDLGVYYNVSVISLGLIAERFAFGARRNYNPTVSLFLGADLYNTCVGYSFSWGVGATSKLFGGSHEISLKYIIDAKYIRSAKTKQDRDVIKQFGMLKFPRY